MDIATKNQSMKLMSAYVPINIHKEKKKLGLSWRALIVRGIDHANNKEKTRVNELTLKIEKMANRLNQQATRIYELEQQTTK